MAIIVFFLAVIYFALFFVVAVYASRNKKKRSSMDFHIPDINTFYFLDHSSRKHHSRTSKSKSTLKE